MPTHRAALGGHLVFGIAIAVGVAATGIAGCAGPSADENESGTDALESKEGASGALTTIPAGRYSAFSKLPFDSFVMTTNAEISAATFTTGPGASRYTIDVIRRRDGVSGPIPMKQVDDFGREVDPRAKYNIVSYVGTFTLSDRTLTLHNETSLTWSWAGYLRVPQTDEEARAATKSELFTRAYEWVAEVRSTFHHTNEPCPGGVNCGTKGHTTTLTLTPPKGDVFTGVQVLSLQP